jgi:hypothetical protein
MKKQEFYNHKKPRKLLDQVSDVMCCAREDRESKARLIRWNRAPGGEPDEYMRPLKNVQFCSSSRKAKIITAGIH